MMAGLTQRLHRWDVRSFTSIYGSSNRAFWTGLCLVLSKTGDGYLYPIIPLLLAVLVPHVAIAFLLAACIGLAIELPVYKVLKHKINRDRPRCTRPLL